jgi:hypothetical protein
MQDSSSVRTELVPPVRNLRFSRPCAKRRRAGDPQPARAALAIAAAHEVAMWMLPVAPRLKDLWWSWCFSVQNGGFFSGIIVKT